MIARAFLVISFLLVSSLTYSADLKLNKPSDKQTKAYDSFFQDNHTKHIEKITEFVAFPTLAMVPDNASDLKAAGQWLVNELERIGMEKATYHPADGFPWVTAEWMKAEGQPTVVFYGHFDVQPVVKENWNTDPWKATLKDGKLYGRGATDDKGYIIGFLSTLEAMLKIDGKLPVNVKLMLDGSEEFGSQTMEKWLAGDEMSRWIKEADFGYSLDAMMQSDDQGLMWRGLRGGGDVEVTVTSANTALHSGIYGGSAPNAVHAAAKIISSAYNEDGSVAIEGFQDDVTTLKDSIRKEIKQAEPGMATTLDKEKLEIARWIGDPDYSVLERTWVQNSMDVTGIKGGYIEGKASVIANTVWFRFMTRTGPGQDPGKLNEKIMAHVKKHTPWGVKVEMKSLAAGAAPYFSEDDRSFQIGRAVLTGFFGKEPVVTYVGGGVPALSYVPDAGGPGLVSFSFQRSDEGFHADNEYMRVESFKKAQKAYVQLLYALVGQPQRDQ